MIFICFLIIAAFTLVHWLHKVNKDYNVSAFFARRVRTKDGRPVESVAPIPKGVTIFANCFDLYGKDDTAVFQYCRKISKEMGKSYIDYHFGMPIYNIFDADITEFVLNDANLLSKGRIYDFMKPVLSNGLLTAASQKWQTRRKMIMPTFHINILNQFLDVFKTESAKIVRQFNQQTEGIVSLSEIIPKFTLNCICETAMGVKVDDMTEKGDRYRSAMKMLGKLFVKRFSNPLYFNKMIYYLIGARQDAPYLKVIHEFSSEIIAKRRILLEKELDHRRLNQLPDEDIYVNERRRFVMLDTLICAEKDGLIDHEGICEEVDTLIFGGFDTSSMLLILTLMNLAMYPDIQEHCHREISEHIYDNLSILDCTQLTKLKYLECCIKETSRLYPPVPVMARQTLTEMVLPKGLIFPPGTQFVMHIFDLHRNEKYWDEPDKFDPNRFLPHNYNNRHPYAYIPFSAGQRNCIGQKYAMVEVKTFLIFILKQFKVLPVTRPEDLIFRSSFTLSIKNNVQVKLVRRNQ